MGLNADDYTNELDLVGFTSNEAINQIENYTLEYYEDAIVTRVEDYVLLPEFCKYMWGVVIQNRHIPSQEEFRNGYLERHESEIARFNFNEEELQGLRARLHRTYASLVRDCVVALQLKESTTLKQADAKIKYNVQLDLKGIDILLIYQNQYYALRCYINTKRGREYFEKKKLRNPDFTNVTYLDFPLEPKYGLDGIWLYDPNLIIYGIQCKISKNKIILKLVEAMNSKDPKDGPLYHRDGGFKEYQLEKAWEVFKEEKMDDVEEMLNLIMNVSGGNANPKMVREFFNGKK